MLLLQFVSCEHNQQINSRAAYVCVGGKWIRTVKTGSWEWNLLISWTVLTKENLTTVAKATVQSSIKSIYNTATESDTSCSSIPVSYTHLDVYKRQL